MTTVRLPSGLDLRKAHDAQMKPFQIKRSIPAQAHLCRFYDNRDVFCELGLRFVSCINESMQNIILEDNLAPYILKWEGYS